MPTIIINGVECEFEQGQTVLQVANAHKVEIPFYCYHDGLSRPAQCRICLAEMWAPNARAGGKLEPVAGGKLHPTCTTLAGDGMVVRADSPKAIANQKAVMEYLLINHPLDCPVCDQAGECFLQDYSYKYGRGTSRFEEQKVKQPKKDLGPHVYLYADRCIMCTRCVRFTREVSGTGELTIDGRGNRSEIDVFPGVALDNELSGNVIDLCPVGALLDKDFLFAQRVWFLRSTPSIDGITSSGDNISVEHNEGVVYRIKPRTNLEINKWWITDEVRYGWKFVHAENRLTRPMRREFGALATTEHAGAISAAVDGLRAVADAGKRIGAIISPMLPIEEAYLIARVALAIDPKAVLSVGPVPRVGEDKIFPPGASEGDANAFKLHAEKAPNARGVRRVLGVLAGETGAEVIEHDAMLAMLGKGSGKSDIGGVLVTGNYPSEWASGALDAALGGKFRVVIDTLDGRMTRSADVVVPGATWLEKSGVFENAGGILQAFEQAIPAIEGARSEGQIALDMLVALGLAEPDSAEIETYSIIDEQPGAVPAARETRMTRVKLYNPAHVRAEMVERHGAFAQIASDVRAPVVEAKREPDMQMVEL